jgi:hypothetical protein
LRPSVQAARTRKAVSTSSFGFIDRLLPLFNTLDLNVCFYT